MHKTTLNWLCFRGEDIFMFFLWICSVETLAPLFSRTTTNINGIAAVFGEDGEEQIYFVISVINSPEEVKKSFDQSHVSLKEILKVPRLVKLINRREGKSEIVTSSPYKRNLQLDQEKKTKINKTHIKSKQKKPKFEPKQPAKTRTQKNLCRKKKIMLRTNKNEISC